MKKDQLHNQDPAHHTNSQRKSLWTGRHENGTRRHSLDDIFSSLAEDIRKAIAGRRDFDEAGKPYFPPAKLSNVWE